MGWKIVEFTGYGYKVEVESDFIIDDLIRAHPATLYLSPNIQEKVKARELLKTLPLNVQTIVSHEPVLHPEVENLLHTKRQSWEDIYLLQRLVLEGDWYIDDFGFYVYCYSFIADCSLLKDLRYESE